LREVEGLSRSKIAEPLIIPLAGVEQYRIWEMKHYRMGEPLNKVRALNFFSLSSFPINTWPVVQQVAQAFRPTATGLIQRTLE